MARILITGGAGFIGSNAAHILSRQGHEVVAFDNLFLGRKENLQPHITFIEGDITRQEDLIKAGKVDYIIHLAAASSAPMFADDLVSAFTTNIIGHINVMEYGRRVGIKKMFFASTSSIYGNNPVPLTEDQAVISPNFYSITKHSQEEVSRLYHQTHGMEIIAFRFMSVYGLHEEHKGRFANLVSQFIWGMEQGKQPVIYDNGDQTRDFTNVKDLILAFTLAIETKEKFGFTVFNVGTSQAITVNNLMHILNKVMRTNISAKHIENPIKVGFVRQQQASLEKIERMLGYKPTVAIEDGIREIIDFRKKNPIKPAGLSY